MFSTFFKEDAEKTRQNYFFFHLQQQKLPIFWKQLSGGKFLMDNESEFLIANATPQLEVICHVHRQRF